MRFFLSGKIGEGALSPIFPEGRRGGLCTDCLSVNAAGVISNEHFNFNVIRICIVLANNLKNVVFDHVDCFLWKKVYNE